MLIILHFPVAETNSSPVGHDLIEAEFAEPLHSTYIRLLRGNGCFKADPSLHSCNRFIPKEQKLRQPSYYLVILNRNISNHPSIYQFILLRTYLVSPSS